MDLFIHLYAVLGIAIRLPEISGEGQLALFRNAITALSRMEKVADQGKTLPAEARQKVAAMRESFVQWRKQEFVLGAAEQREIIAAAVGLAGEEDYSGL